MGEKDYMNGIIGWLTDNTTGKAIAWTSLKNVEFSTNSEVTYKEPDNTDEIYATIPRDQEFHATGTLLMTRFNKYILFYGVPDNRRMVRRAIRWEEKLRRLGHPEALRKLRAAECALYNSNNGRKRNRQKGCEWEFIIKEAF